MMSFKRVKNLKNILCTKKTNIICNDLKLYYRNILKNVRCL